MFRLSLIVLSDFCMHSYYYSLSMDLDNEVAFHRILKESEKSTKEGDKRANVIPLYVSQSRKMK